MIGFSAWIPKLFFLLVASVFVVALYNEWKPVVQGKTRFTGKRLFATVFVLVWAILLLQLFIREARFHQQLNHLTADSVDRIDVGSTSMTGRNDIAAITSALNQCQSFSVNHGGWADDLPLLIHLKDGRVLTYRVALYLRTRGAILSSQSNYEGKGFRWSNGYLFSAALPDVLARSGISLPSCRSVGDRPCGK